MCVLCVVCRLEVMVWCVVFVVCCVLVAVCCVCGAVACSLLRDM